MSRLNDKHNRTTWATVSNTFESNFGNNNLGQCVLEPALDGSGGHVVYTSSQFPV